MTGCPGNPDIEHTFHSACVGKYDFSKVWSVGQAIKETLTVDVHPAINTQKYLILKDTSHYKDLKICVAPNQEIHLFNHRLYMHEFLTHPPLKELRVIFKEDEGPLNQQNDTKVVFVVSRSIHPNQNSASEMDFFDR